MILTSKIAQHDTVGVDLGGTGRVAWRDRPRGLRELPDGASEPSLNAVKADSAPLLFTRHPALAGDQAPFIRFDQSEGGATSQDRRPCTPRRIRQETDSCRRRTGRGARRGRRRQSRSAGRAGALAATPPCGRGLSQNRQPPGAVTVTSNRRPIPVRNRTAADYIAVTAAAIGGPGRDFAAAENTRSSDRPTYTSCAVGAESGTSWLG